MAQAASLPPSWALQDFEELGAKATAGAAGEAVHFIDATRASLEGSLCLFSGSPTLVYDLLGISLCHPLQQADIFLAAREDQRQRRLTVAPGSAKLLQVVLRRGGVLPMDDEAHIGDV